MSAAVASCVARGSRAAVSLSRRKASQPLPAIASNMREYSVAMQAPSENFKNQMMQDVLRAHAIERRSENFAEMTVLCGIHDEYVDDLVGNLRRFAEQQKRAQLDLATLESSATVDCPDVGALKVKVNMLESESLKVCSELRDEFAFAVSAV